VKIHIRRIKLKMILGAWQHEKIAPQEVWVSIKLKIDPTDAIKSDKLVDTLDYFELTKQVKSFLEDNKFELVETAVHQTSEIIMQDKRVIKARVKIYKPEALKNFGAVVSVSN
jgi:FolB domain-containing protein